MRRHYQQHDHNCGGIDWVVVQRILHAGTIDVFPADHLICDCERAAVVATAPMAETILKINGTTLKKLRQLWATLEGNTNAQQPIHRGK